jgi:hypothetical protein
MSLSFAIAPFAVTENTTPGNGEERLLTNSLLAPKHRLQQSLNTVQVQ